jgi:hypothetical protein
MAFAWSLPRPTRSRSAGTRRLLGLTAVADTVLWRDDGHLVAVLAASAPSLALRGREEAARLIETLRLVLAALTEPLQIVVALGPLDIDAAVAAHAQATAAEPEPCLRRLAADHRAFLRSLAHDHQLLERRAYLAISVPTDSAPSSQTGVRRLLTPSGRREAATAGSAAGVQTLPGAARRELAARCAELDRRLRPAGIVVRRLAGAELAGLFYGLVQPDLARRQPLPADLTELAANPVTVAGRPATGHAATLHPATGQPMPGAPERLGRLLAGYLAPGAVEEAADWLRIDDRSAASLAVIGYRREVGLDWLAPLWRSGLPLRVAFHLEPLPDRTALARLERRKTRLEAAAAVDAHQGRTRSASAAVALEDVTALEEAVERGAERLLMLGLTLTIEADSPAHLTERVRHLESVLGGLGLRSARLRFGQPAGYRATLPLGRDEVGRSQAMTAAAVAAAFPLAGGGEPGDGVVLGVDGDGGGLVELPLTVGTNRNLVVLGPSGGGKSYAVKAALLQAVLRRVAVWVVDREGEYAPLVQAAGGVTIRLAPGAMIGPDPARPGQGTISGGPSGRAEPDRTAVQPSHRCGRARRPS